ncbi:phosphomannomutase/phosphoglucomutase [Thiomicrorhabdus sp. ZW0627]|uniref:phosphomannomutase/phosphoglucomutase n=1 Tax=Thiomicrorhabdus sp. ZW0627 TaxID=3039774 RepID=UPI002436417A|nr:phosphomannomutase/phosphoglucomutase [Thiomicrorhabdus sp. ZW0627]MDG6773867.1 phosphomannomutase/phosphoglucomutase [Thiomicrorhabdus sp. ZW0627]
MTQVVESIFRAYDIRGVVDEALTEETVELIGRALGSEVIQAGQTKIVIGRDGRLSGPRLIERLAKGLQSTGVDVIYLGEVTTPMIYFAAATMDDVNSCAAITGSHNPPNYNGIKMVVDGDTLSGEWIQMLLKRIQNDDFETGSGSFSQADISQAYHDAIVGEIKLKRPLKVVVDAGNGVAGEYAPNIIRDLGCEVHELFCDVDGTFPNHHPDPAKPKNLVDLISKVKEVGADIGLAFDGDGDRCGVVDDQGKVLYADRQMMLFARDVLSRQPGAEILFDIKCTSLLPKEIEADGGKATMWKTGHSFMKAKLKETGAALAGEVSGHIFFKERWYGFDDGIYGAARMLEIVAGQSQPASELFAELPDAYNTPEMDVEFAEGEHYAFMEKFKKIAHFPDAEIFDLDGIRADFADGWGLVRPSNTTPVLVMRFEGETPEALARIQDEFKRLIHQVDPSLKLPF